MEFSVWDFFVSRIDRKEGVSIVTGLFYKIP